MSTLQGLKALQSLPELRVNWSRRVLPKKIWGEKLDHAVAMPLLLSPARQLSWSHHQVGWALLFRPSGKDLAWAQKAMPLQNVHAVPVRSILALCPKIAHLPRGADDLVEQVAESQCWKALKDDQLPSPPEILLDLQHRETQKSLDW